MSHFVGKDKAGSLSSMPIAAASVAIAMTLSTFGIAFFVIHKDFDGCLQLSQGPEGIILQVGCDPARR